ncbi:M10 family metallopeptidase C-terminal domain-containing protein [Kordiimonas laminariae]|uniref:M10 family metallopeptidase C-terminal domain-containing protein n=1 Tax=Kordiimonas laminariae TaxID=2917717 RepID=UPI001FF3B517|nr:M10 family metallopeptidase C-terminal domain-containing protein [Kordiimonas laminariae]MCK0069051.1 M10 family metallopeptidase C-terminal domain-containing protein [Kordiimonas laminariae]
MTDLQYSWKFYAHGMLFNPQHTGDIKGNADQITLDTNLRANAGSPLGTGITIRYSFENGAPDGYDPSGFLNSSITAENKALFEKVFDEYSAIANITFIEVGQGQNADLEIYRRNTAGGGEAGRLDGPQDSTAMIVGVADGFDLTQLSEDFYKDDILLAIRHELGHVLGLDHPRGQEGSFLTAHDVHDPNSNDIPFEEATDRFTVMSYVNNEDFYERGGLKGQYFETVHNTWGLTTNQSLGLFDIKTLQYLYGANTSTNTGDDTYSFRPEDASVLTVYDAGGIDTFDFSNQLTGVKANLGEATFSSVGYYYTNARLSGFSAEPADLETRPEVLVTANNNVSIAWDTVIENAIGSDHKDTLRGNSADNNIQGKDGDDLLIAYEGSDTVTGGNGNDTIWAGAGDKGADYVDGGAGRDIVAGGAGDDTLFGGDDADTLYGGTGDDLIIVTTQGETDTLSNTNEIAYGGSGTDIIQAAAGDDILGGGFGDDSVYGNNGNDTIFGGKGEGNDELHGGEGNDTLYGGKGDDRVIGDEGNDLLFGGSGNDLIMSMAGDDTIWGGTGDDTLIGGDGTDTFLFKENQGNNLIQHFDAGEDIVNLSAFGVSNIRDIASDVDNGSGSTALTFTFDESTSVTLSSYTMADLDSLNIII